MLIRNSRPREAEGRSARQSASSSCPPLQGSGMIDPTPSDPGNLLAELIVEATSHKERRQDSSLSAISPSAQVEMVNACGGGNKASRGLGRIRQPPSKCSLAPASSFSACREKSHSSHKREISRPQTHPLPSVLSSE